MTPITNNDNNETYSDRKDENENDNNDENGDDNNISFPIIKSYTGQNLKLLQCFPNSLEKNWSDFCLQF